MRGILTYHSIDDSGSPVSLDPTTFRRHLDWLKSDAVQVVPLAELVELGDDVDAVALTFDDAFASFHELAWPLLREHGLPATVFVPTGRVGRDNAWNERTARGIPTLSLCDWDQLGEMLEQGLDVGSHTVNHVRLDGMGADLVHAELSLSAETLRDRLGRQPLHLAYPYGAFDERAESIASELYSLAVTTELRPLTSADRPHCLPRIDACYLRPPKLLESWGRRPFTQYLWLRAAGRRVRSALGV